MIRNITYEYIPTEKQITLVKANLPRPWPIILSIYSEVTTIISFLKCEMALKTVEIKMRMTSDNLHIVLNTVPGI